ncbi:putative sugar nucleotidyl transferase [Membranihabitans maritimus]|uniref:putative sugar nucleotidyl transferase n=1 Tax=Membranihabitans maritimus TaxID=2904244 RepID=UPI001F428402|nr:putative sugar nucleotidyl transferase [Membranihabitans maritimus]
MKFYNINFKTFFPLTLTKSTSEILFGLHTLGEKWKNVRINTHKSQELYINPLAIPNPTLITEINQLPENTNLFYGKSLIASKINKLKITDTTITSTIPDLQKMETISEPEIVIDLTYLLKNNAKQIIEEIKSLESTEWQGKWTSFEKDVYIHHSARVENALIDSSDGPVFIGRNAYVMNGSILKGPLAILDNVVLKMGAKIYPGTSIGPHSAVGGEIKNSIIHPFSNKTHDGYLGDSILGSWNNLGANTNVSNVSNNFDFIKSVDWASGNIITLSTIKRGVVTGDFVKTGINTTIYSGTLIGPFCSLATTLPIKGLIPSIRWITNEKNTTYQLEKLISHCKNQMQLKNREWTDDWEQILKIVADQKIKGASDDKMV